jgi:hypothetical protein
MSYLSDKEIEDVGKKVAELYKNKDILKIKNDGRQLGGQLKTLTDRNISGIYSNIQNQLSIQTVLKNSIRFGIFVEKDIEIMKQISVLKQACNERHNLTNNKDIDIVKNAIEEISLLEDEIKKLEEKIYEPPDYRKNILEIAQKAYKILLRSDKSSEKLYIAVCNKLNVKVENDHFGYYQYNQSNQYNQYNYKKDYTNDQYRPPSQYSQYSQRYNNKDEEKKDVYVPPALKYKKFGRND